MTLTGAPGQEPVNLAYLNRPDIESAAFAPCLSRDRLTLFYCFQPKADGTSRIAFAQRTSLDEPFVFVTPEEDLLLLSNNLHLGMGIFQSNIDDLYQAFNFVERASEIKLNISDLLKQAVQDEQEALRLLVKVSNERELSVHEKDQLKRLMQHLAFALLNEGRPQSYGEH